MNDVRAPAGARTEVRGAAACAMPGRDVPSGWRARALGHAAGDLDIAFDSDRASIVTALLAACVSDAQGRAVDAASVWDWTLSQRLQALIAVRRAGGTEQLDVQAPCAQCTEQMAITLALDDFATAPAAPRFTWRSPEGVLLSLRLPSGHDLRRWQHEGAPERQAMAASLVEAVDGVAADIGADELAAWLPALDDAFEAHDPLTALHLHAACPACAHDNDIACDLESLLVDGLARTQDGLLDEVAQLAAALHWSESAIMSLPAWRRARYLQRVSRETGP
jgi:hypothetical protein